MPFLKRHWVRGVTLLITLVAVFFLAYGLAAGSGSGQWGPYSAWVASALTLGAVGIALRETFKGDKARRVDHELARRRECIDAMSEVWSAVTKMALHLQVYTDYLDNLPQEFDREAARSDNVKPIFPGEPIALEIGTNSMNFFNLWVDALHPPFFRALALTRGTALDGPLVALNNSVTELMDVNIKAAGETAVTGRRPDISAIDQKWGEILRRKQAHLELVRKHFGLGLTDAELTALTNPQPIDRRRRTHDR
jgi:hypothetical protein